MAKQGTHESKTLGCFPAHGGGFSTGIDRSKARLQLYFRAGGRNHVEAPSTFLDNQTTGSRRQSPG